MISLYCEQVVDLDDPAMVWAVVDCDGFLVDPDLLRYRIRSIGTEGLEEVLEWTDVDLEADRISLGRFVCNWEVPADADTEVFYRLEAEWVEGGRTRKAYKTFEVLPYDLGLDGTHFCFMKDLLDEGIMTDEDDLNRYAKLIKSVSSQIRKITRRNFATEYKTLKLDAMSSSSIVALSESIIGVEKVRFPEYFETNQDETTFEVYARHLSQNLLQPDDRDYPHLKFHGGLLGVVQERQPAKFRAGPQGVEIVGLFGYTDPDGSCDGETPDDIRRVCIAMVNRESPVISDTDERESRMDRGFITHESTHSQSYTKDAQGVSKGVTGDRWIDNTLARYTLSFTIGVL